MNRQGPKPAPSVPRDPAAASARQAAIAVNRRITDARALPRRSQMYNMLCAAKGQLSPLSLPRSVDGIALWFCTLRPNRSCDRALPL